MRGLPLDGVVLVVPSCCGWRATGANRDDPNLANNKFYFDQLIRRTRYPLVGVFFLGDEYEPADRGKDAATTLTGLHVPNLIIDHPPGFEGHGSAWFPVFDYEYGACIAKFLETPAARGSCLQRAIPADDRDFRAVLSASQLSGDRRAHNAVLSDMQGRQFAVYPDGDVRTIVASDKTKVKGFGMGDSVFASSFRGDLYCVRARVKYAQPQSTDETCVNFVKWSDHDILAIDMPSGDVVQWWVEHP
jgi:hypothetical protein